VKFRLLTIAAVSMLGIADGLAQTNAPAGKTTAGPAATNAVAPTFVPYRYTYTMLQVHAFPHYEPWGSDTIKAMFERIGTFTYGDDYFFLSVTSDHEDDWSANTGTLYYKYAPCLSLDKVFGTEIVPLDYVGDTFLTVQANSGDHPELGLRTVWLGGVAFDVAKAPYYGRWRLYLLARQEESMRMTHQITLMWAQPFYVGNWRFIFNGWGAHWDNDTELDVMKFEPQLRFCLSNVLGKGNFLYDAHLGAELEMSHHYQPDLDHPGEVMDWVFNPSVFVAWEY
jgi:hypothetical protein